MSVYDHYKVFEIEMGTEENIKNKSKVLTIKIADDESPDYDKVAARIDDRLQKLFS